MASPLLLSPVGVLGLCAQEGHGDFATARAAARSGVPMVASTLSEDPLEDVAAALGDAPGLFQLYTPADASSPRASWIGPRRRASGRSS